MDEFGCTLVEFMAGPQGEPKSTSQIEPFVTDDEMYKDALHHIVLCTFTVSTEYKGIGN